jgi:hypothetical protein
MGVPRGERIEGLGEPGGGPAYGVGHGRILRQRQTEAKGKYNYVRACFLSVG